MNILIDIGHPAHVHLFRNFYSEIKHKGHSVIVTVKNNLEAAKQLLSYYGMPFISIGSKSNNILIKAMKQIAYDLSIAQLVMKYKIEIGIGTSINLAHVSKISKMYSIILDDDDDDVQPLFTKYAHPFCDTILSPYALIGNRKKNGTVFYPGFHELAYLHPNRFIPDTEIYTDIGLTEKERYYILRFNAFKAHHDSKAQGLSREARRNIISVLKPRGKVFITTEDEYDSELNEYKINMPLHKIHSLIYYADMFIGDSQTMTTEAAILGTPALKCNSFAGKLSVPNEIEKKYDLCYSYQPNDFSKLIIKIMELLTISNLKEQWQAKRQRLLNNNIDVTSFLVWFVENYPNSMNILNRNPQVMETFK